MDIHKLEIIFNCCIGAGIAIPLLDVLVGTIGTVLDFDFDFDGDTHFDGPLGLSVKSLSLMAVIFGACGRLFLRFMLPVIAILISLALALCGGYLFNRFIMRPLKRSRPLAKGMKDLRWMEGVVKLEIRSDFVGTITVLSATNSLVTYSARPDEGVDKIAIGQKVLITDVDMEKKVCVVRPII